MKTKSFTCLFSAALAFATGFTTRAAQAETLLPPSHATMTISVSSDEPTVAVQFDDSAGRNPTPAQWIDIKDCPSEKRDVFFVGFKRLEILVNAQINELTSQRPARKTPAEIKAWDSAMMEMGNARFFLTAMGKSLGSATPQTWNQQKIKAGLAWANMQETFARVKALTRPTLADNR